MFEKTQETLKVDFNTSLINIKDEIGKNIVEFKDRYYDEVNYFCYSARRKQASIFKVAR